MPSLQAEFPKNSTACLIDPKILSSSRHFTGFGLVFPLV